MMKIYFDPKNTSRRQRAASREGMVTTTFALDSEQYARLTALSDATRVTRNTLVRQAIEEFLDRRESGARERRK